MNFFAPNSAKEPTYFENKMLSGFHNTLSLLKSILALTKKVFML